MLRIFRVSGESLTPEYQHGDFVLVSKIPFLFHPPIEGDVIAFHQPGYGLLIKRVQAIDEIGGITVLGTQLDSTDSRVFGAVQRKDIIGKVIWHIRKR